MERGIINISLSQNFKLHLKFSGKYKRKDSGCPGVTEQISTTFIAPLGNVFLDIKRYFG